MKVITIHCALLLALICDLSLAQLAQSEPGDIERGSYQVVEMDPRPPEKTPQTKKLEQKLTEADGVVTNFVDYLKDWRESSIVLVSIIAVIALLSLMGNVKQ